jgi:hypothetical protein
MPATAASILSTFRPLTLKRAPASAKRSAIPRLTPDEPPVRKACLPARRSERKVDDMAGLPGARRCGEVRARGNVARLAGCGVR